tara:strand:- start:6952 stop:7206 length:255 start_codon:yes stop_codon:yes gene_type:complete
MNNLKMLEMALNALKQCTSNEWVDNQMGERYNIEEALSKIKKSRIETYSEQMQNELEPIEEPLGGVASDWTFHTTDDDCEFENG